MTGQAARTVFEAGWQGQKVRWLARVFIPLGIPMMLFAIWMLFELRAVDGTLEPFEARLAVSALVFVTGFLCSLGMWVYVTIYPMRLSRDGDAVIMETARLFGDVRTALPITHFGSRTFHKGRLGAAGSVERRMGFRFDINTPFSTVAIAGWWLPMLIDHQGTGFDAAALERLAKDAERARQNAPSTERVPGAKKPQTRQSR